MTYSVVIERVADGRRVLVPMGEWTAEDDATLFIWTDGNFACDCNRKIFFERAEGRLLEDVFCGETAYRVIEYQLSDGSVVPGLES